MNYSKNNLNYFKYNVFCFHKFFKTFLGIYKNEKSKLQNRFENYAKNQLNCLKYNMFCSHNFSKNHCEYIRTENPSYKIAWNHSKINWIVLNTINIS